MSTESNQKNSVNSNSGNQTTSKMRAWNMQHYLQKKYPKDMQEFNQGQALSTGYKNIDLETQLYQGLYVVGAIPSLGKTTFISQMCDQLAEQMQQPVLYFSLEMNILEMTTKSLSRLTARLDINQTSSLTAMQIRKGQKNDVLEEAKAKYLTFADKIMIAECPLSVTITDIENLINQYIQTYKVKPVVVIDYLQVIQPAPGSRLTSKEQVDMHVQHLKRLQEENKIVLILISSFNRQNYLSQVDFESFKESGGIEYTADVVWGLQMHVLSTPEFNREKDTNAKRKMVREQKKAIPRQIDLVCLKNRFGTSSYTCRFRYYANYDYFVEVLEGF